MNKETIKLQQSESWDCAYSLSELIERSEFVYKLKHGLGGGSPHLKLREPIEGMTVVQITYDYSGITYGGIGIFNNFEGDQIEDSSKDIEKFIYDFLEKEGATVNGEWNPYKPTPLKSIK